MFGKKIRGWYGSGYLSVLLWSVSERRSYYGLFFFFVKHTALLLSISLSFFLFHAALFYSPFLILSSFWRASSVSWTYSSYTQQFSPSDASTV